MMKEMPLCIQIYNRSDNELVISNTIQKKDSPVDSTKVGLQNINAKYRLLNQPGIMIEKNDQTFSVVVQLIEDFSTPGN
jgi:two-component system, LytTR family, sensor kinase